MEKDKGARMDMLHGSIWDKLVLFSLPLAATGILQQLFNAADVAVVGQFVGNAAQAAVGSNGAIINLLVNLFIGVSLGSNVVISQFIGSGDVEGIRKAVHTSIVFSVLGGAALAVLGQFIATPVISAMGVPDDVYDMAVLYLRIYMAGMPVILLYNFESAIYRSKGDTKTPLLILLLSGVVNVALNILFVAGLHMTVDGVAIATVVSNLVSSAVLLWLLTRERGPLRVERSALKMDMKTLRRMMRVGIPAGVQGMVFSLANICIQSAINSLDTVVMAASSAASYLETFTYSVLNAFGQACTTFVGQNCGAGNLQRCHRGLWVTFASGYSVFAVTAVALFFLAEPLLRVFNPDPAVIEIGLVRVRYLIVAHIFSLAVEVLSGYLRGFGMSLVPAVCALVFICGIRIVWVYGFFPQNPTFAFLMMSYPVSLAVTAAIIAGVCAVMRRRIDRRVLASAAQ